MANMQFGRTENGSLGLYIDSISNIGGYVTDLVCYDGRTAANRTIDQASGSGSRTWRPISVFCSDINGDGRLDIPISHSFSVTANETESRARLDWYNVDTDGVETVVGSSLNAVTENWYLIWPERWGDQVRVTKSSGTGFSKTVFSLQKGEDTQELLSIWLFSGDGQDSAASVYKRLGTLDSTTAGVYRFSLSQTADSAFALTEDELRELFHTVESGWHIEEY